MSAASRRRARRSGCRAWAARAGRGEGGRRRRADTQGGHFGRLQPGLARVARSSRGYVEGRGAEGGRLGGEALWGRAHVYIVGLSGSGRGCVSMLSSCASVTSLSSSAASSNRVSITSL